MTPTTSFFLLLLSSTALVAQTPPTGPRMVRDPAGIYINWAAYDEISDNVPLTEELAMKQFDELLRLRRLGVRFDYYINDAFWYARDGGYRLFRKPNWPKGPDAWLERCRKEGVKPGLWLGVNTLWAQLDPVPEWESSLGPKRMAACLFEGGYLKHYMETMQHWYDRGIRIFKFDFADFQAAPEAVQRKYTKEEIRSKNEAAFRDALFRFREKNPDVMLIAYNGFGGDQGGTALPFRKSVDLRWLDVFDSMYCGDPRLADLPAMSFWRSKDVYTNHMALRYGRDNVPLERIDSSSFMIGTTGTCYNRRASAWKGMLLLTLARGGLVNTFYGNLELLSDKDAAWFAKVQAMYFRIHALGRFRAFGGVPGEGEPHGFAAIDAGGSLYTVVNPSQLVLTVPLPRFSSHQPNLAGGRVLFRDAGFRPLLSGDKITLGPEQLALVGYGSYAQPAHDLGIQEDVVIPTSIERLPAMFVSEGKDAIVATVPAPAAGDLRIVMRQFGPDGAPLRSRGGAPPKGQSMSKIFVLWARQGEKNCPIRIEYDKAIWSGLSWAAGEVRREDFTPGQPVTVRCSSTEKRDFTLKAELYAVTYER